MIEKAEIASLLKKYKTPRIATLCSHTALQIFHGARLEGIKTIGICKRSAEKTYSAFPFAKPDEFLYVENFGEILGEKIQEKLRGANAIVVPHGSFVEYVGARNIGEKFAVPTFGNRKSLLWEGDREKLFEWMRTAGLRIPRTLKPEQIDAPAIVKLPGAKGGQGYVIVNSPSEFREKVKEKNVMIQEFLIGVRVYPHYFHSLASNAGYPAEKGAIELMSIDRRLESNIDEIYRGMSAGAKTPPSFTVVGNEPLVVRESLIPAVMDMGKRVVESAEKLFGGIPGPFCIETICDSDMKFHAFEISARIVAGTNLYPLGSQYSPYLFKEPMSTGRRIALEIKLAAKRKMLEKVVF